MSCPVIILGAGGHAKVLIDALRLQSATLIGVTDANPAKKGQLFLGLPVMGGDDVLLEYPAETINLVNGVGSVRVSPHRRQLFEKFKGRGYRFANVTHPSAIISGDAMLHEGAQIMAGAIIQAGCFVGINAVINSGAVVDHDCYVGDHVHISPGVTLSGGVRVEEGAHIGAGATVIQGIKIGRNSLVAAGSVVVRDVPDSVVVMGVPAKAELK